MAKIKDSGQRSEFKTGAVRDIQSGKGRYDLVPPEAIRRVAKIFEGGAEKYGGNNWRKGIPMHCFMNSGKRHLDKYIEGWKDEDHLAMACWNLMAAIATEEMVAKGLLDEEIMDIPNYMPEGAEELF